MDALAQRLALVLGQRPLVFLVLLVIAILVGVGVITLAAMRLAEAGARLGPKSPQPDARLAPAAIVATIATAALGFSALAFAVSSPGTVVNVDRALADALHSSAEPGTLTFFRAFTYLGSEGVVVLGFVGVAMFVASKRHALAGGWCAALIGGGLLNFALKAYFSRPRPWFEVPVVTAGGFSFPSGHSMSTWIAMGMLVYASRAFVEDRTKRILLMGSALSFSAAMGFSRMVLGVHYLSDVIAGFAAGTVWLGLCVLAVEVIRSRPQAEPR